MTTMYVWKKLLYQGLSIEIIGNTYKNYIIFCSFSLLKRKDDHLLMHILQKIFSIKKGFEYTY